jgi:hypothetical protein
MVDDNSIGGGPGVALTGDKVQGLGVRVCALGLGLWLGFRVRFRV